MKNILEILKELGLEVPADKHEALNKAVAENYKTTAEFEKTKAKLEAEKNGAEEQLKAVQESLKKFDGVNVDELNGKIKQLTDDMAKQDADYKAQIADMEFMGVLDAAVAGSGAKNSL